jgi:queuine tRNA-ribosyltransferase
MFELLAHHPNTKSRRGRLTTGHGVVETPAFMPVGTQGTVKGVSPQELRELNAEVILGNTYHLFVRPGLDVIRHVGGLHRFMNWDGPILTDSGGYQIFSLAKLRKITDEGVQFQNHVDGTPAFISPEIAMEIQQTLGSDIAMVLDECPPWPCPREYAARSLEMTLRWAKRCKAWMGANAERRTPNAERRVRDSEGINAEGSVQHAPPTGYEPATVRSLVFGIVQGASFDDLRRQSAEALVEIGFDGYAVGGVSVGEPEEEMMRAVEASEPALPANKPRYAMGLGTPPQILEMIGRGIDMFDCVLPTRSGRNGQAFTTEGALNLRNARFAEDTGPLDPACPCPACTRFSRAYLHHVVKAGEIIAAMLLTWHNLAFYQGTMAGLRRAIAQARTEQWAAKFPHGGFA